MVLLHSSVSGNSPSESQLATFFSLSFYSIRSVKPTTMASSSKVVRPTSARKKNNRNLSRSPSPIVTSPRLLSSEKQLETKDKRSGKKEKDIDKIFESVIQTTEGFHDMHHRNFDLSSSQATTTSLHSSS